MVWTAVKLNNKRLNKDTRWDRIRKRHTSSHSITTTAIKKLVDIDFIGKNNLKILNGEIDATRKLNPALVMDLRHEKHSRRTKRKSSTRIPKYKANIDKCIVHNMEVEERFIHHELSKFRNQLQKNRNRCKVKPKSLQEDKYPLNNKEIIRSLENTTRHIDHFYESPALAIEQFNTFRSTLEKSLAENNNKRDTQSNVIKNRNEFRSVQFTDSVDIINRNDTQDKVFLEQSMTEMSIATMIEKEAMKESQDQAPNIVTQSQSKDVDGILENALDFYEGVSNLTMEALKEVQEENSFTETCDNKELEECSQSTNFTHPLVVTKILPKQDVEQSTQLAPITSITAEAESYTDEQNEVIDEIFQMTNTFTNMKLLKNYFLKWIHYATFQKIERDNVTTRNDRVHKINSFLDHIRKEKKKCQPQESVNEQQLALTNSQLYNIERKYKSKIRIQQDIIDLQRYRLERQERVISELKLKKLSEEAKEDRNDIKAELKSALRNGDAAMRAKAKCLQIMGNLRDEDDEEFTRLQGKAMIQPKFLTNMQERALERSCKHEEAKKRRLQKEAEREAAKAAMEEAKRLEDEESKRMRIEELKEKRRQEKMAKVLKEFQRQKAIQNNGKAQEFCRTYLLRRVGMNVFKKALERKRSIHRQVELFRKRMITKNAFNAWKKIYLFERERKICLADDLHEKISKRSALKGWKEYMRLEYSKYLVAVDWHELNLVQAVFTQWCGYTKLQKITEDKKMKQAELHHEWHLKWKVLDRWQRLPQVLRLEKETDERRQRWRMKIWELLPDYKPYPDDDEMS